MKREKFEIFQFLFILCEVSERKDVQEMRKNPILIFLMSILCVMTLAFAGCGDGADGKLHDGYYREVIMQPNGEFIGKGKLSESDVAKTGIAYKVEMSKDNKDQVAKVTSVYGDQSIRTTLWKMKGELWIGNFATIAVTPQENGYIKYEFFDAGGNPCAGFFWANSIRFKQDEKSKQVTAAYLYNENGENKIEGLHSISQLLFEYDKNGRLNKITAADENGNPQEAANLGGGNARALLIKYDQKKEDQISELTWVNAGGNATKGMYWASEQFTYDEKGRITEKAYFGADGNPIDVQYTRGMLSYDGGIETPGELQRICREFKAGCLEAGAVTKYTYNENSMFPSQIDFLGKSGQSYGLESRNHISSVKAEYDEKGNVIKYSTYGSDGTAKALLGKIDTIGLTYDGQGNISKVVYYHGDNATPLDYWKFRNHNVSEIQYTYDDHGRVASASYYDANGSPTDLQIYGKIKYQKTTYSYDDNGYQKEEAMYAQDGTEISADPLKAIYGKYKIVNPVTVSEKAGIVELKENEYVLSIDPQYAAEYESMYHRTLPTKSEKVVYTANIDKMTGKGTLKIGSYDIMDVDIGAGTLKEYGTTLKRID